MAPISGALEKAGSALKEHRTAAALGALGVGVAAGALIYSRSRAPAVPAEGPYPVGSLPTDAYDAVVVGAGPSGSTCAFYLASGGGKVALLDKATFPRGG